LAYEFDGGFGEGGGRLLRHAPRLGRARRPARHPHCGEVAVWASQCRRRLDAGWP